MPEARRYTDREVRDIIDRALAAQADDGSSGTSHADLLAIGEQIGISAPAMGRAAEALSRERLDLAATTAIKSRRRKWLALHGGVFAVVNGLLFAVNALTTPGEWWALFPIVIGGLLLGLHASSAFAWGISDRALDRERAKLQTSPSVGGRRRARVEGEPTPVEEASVDDEAVSTSEERLR